jgi:adenosylmethionine-8-amino-7-oxononanoate aminotransferase
LYQEGCEEQDYSGIPGARSPLFYQQDRQLPTAVRGEGIYIWDAEGRRYLDGCSGAVTVNVGHNNRRVIERAREQLDKISFAYRTQFESEPASELADLLVRLSPPGLDRVFFVNSGSEAVETAIKLVRQHWWNTGKQGKHLIISRQPAYHGATLGALACTSYAPLNIPFYAMGGLAPKVSAPFCYHCPLTKEYPGCNLACALELERAIRLLGADNVAAFIAEPIGGASTGAAVPPDEYFPIVEKICHDNQVALIIDDVMTGCGRTGAFYGFQHWDITPDAVALSKGLSGGYTPIGACLATDELVRPVLEGGGFMHGHTFAGNPLSTAVAAEVIHCVIDDGLVENARAQGTLLHERLRELRARYPIIGDVRGRGLLSGVEFVADAVERVPFPGHWYVAREATELARQAGLLIYPRRSLFGLGGDHVLIAPPLTIEAAEIEELVALFEITVSELSEMVARHVELEPMQPAHDRTHERYHQVDDLPGYAVGDIDDVAPPDEPNATGSMINPDLEAQGATFYDDVLPLKLGSTAPSEVPGAVGKEPADR